MLEKNVKIRVAEKLKTEMSITTNDMLKEDT